MSETSIVERERQAYHRAAGKAKTPRHVRDLLQAERRRLAWWKDFSAGPAADSVHRRAIAEVEGRIVKLEKRLAAMMKPLPRKV